MAWHAKEVVRSIYEIPDPEVAAEFVEQLGIDLQDESCPPEVRSLGRSIVRWRDQIVAWHEVLVSNGPTEAVNNLIPVFGWRSPAGGDGFLMVGDRAGSDSKFISTGAYVRWYA